MLPERAIETGGTTTDSCLVSIRSTAYIEARNWGGWSSQYTLTVAESALFGVD